MRSLFSFWHFNIMMTLLMAVLVMAYLYSVNFTLKKKSIYFFSGILLLLLCVSSPLHFIGDHYLFSAHMITHVLVLLIAAPLIVAGIPAENKFRKPLKNLSRIVSHMPFLAWFCGVGIMWFWHIPYIFDHLVAMHDMSSMTGSANILMTIQMLSLLLGGIIFCWPVINPFREYTIAPLAAVLYLSTACISCSLLGLIITFAPVETYTQYITAMGSDGYLSMIRNNWLISAGMDQQIAGLIMWVPCCFIYLSASMFLLIKWFNQRDSKLQMGIYQQ